MIAGTCWRSPSASRRRCSRLSTTCWCGRCRIAIPRRWSRFSSAPDRARDAVCTREDVRAWQDSGVFSAVAGAVQQPAILDGQSGLSTKPAFGSRLGPSKWSASLRCTDARSWMAKAGKERRIASSSPNACGAANTRAIPGSSAAGYGSPAIRRRLWASCQAPSASPTGGRRCGVRRPDRSSVQHRGTSHEGLRASASRDSARRRSASGDNGRERQHGFRERTPRDLAKSRRRFPRRLSRTAMRRLQAA